MIVLAISMHAPPSSAEIRVQACLAAMAINVWLAASTTGQWFWYWVSINVPTSDSARENDQTEFLRGIETQINRDMEGEGGIYASNTVDCEWLPSCDEIVITPAQRPKVFTHPY